MKLNAKALANRVHGRRLDRSLEFREFPEKLFDARRCNGPGELERPGSGIAHAMPHPPWRIDHTSGNHRRGFSLERDAGLSFMDEQHLILVQMTVDRDGGSGQQRLCPHGIGASGSLGIELNDDNTRRGRPKLEDLAIARVQDMGQRICCHVHLDV